MVINGKYGLHGDRNSAMTTIQQIFDLSGKDAVVTGGAMGIGLGIATRLAEAGAGVLIDDIKLEAAEAATKLINIDSNKASATSATLPILLKRLPWSNPVWSLTGTSASWSTTLRYSRSLQWIR
jgi:hypothetical protein